MGYLNIRKKINKFYTGGQFGFAEQSELDLIRLNMKSVGFQGLSNETRSRYLDLISLEGDFDEEQENQLQLELALPGIQTLTQELEALLDQQTALRELQKSLLNVTNMVNSSIAEFQEQLLNDAIQSNKDKMNGGIASAFGVNSNFIGSDKGQMGAAGAAATGIISTVGVQAMNAVDELAMGDKNFGGQSQAIDSAVHGASKALMSSGNPYAMAAGAALEGANFLTKAGGQTVQGFDVNIDNSGYGNLGHMESSSSRDFGAMIGLGGLNKKSMQDKLARRNEQARMALTAAQISEDTKFEQEARSNSIENVLMNNQMALAGGIDTTLLGS